MKKAMYSFKYGNAKFIALPWPKIKDNKKKLKWLKRELRKVRGKHIFIFKHRPHYKDLEGKENATTKLYDRYNVTAVFSGHDIFIIEQNNTNYIISAGAGASIYPLNREKDTLKDDVYYGKRTKNNDASPYKFCDADDPVTDIPKAMY